MPIRSINKPEDNLVIIVHEGAVEDDEFEKFYREFYEDGSFDKSSDLLVDLHKTLSSVRSATALTRLAYFLKKQYEDVTSNPKVAVVAPKDVSFGLARMYEAFSSDIEWDFVVFRSARAALAWLGQPDELIDEFR
jgi:hypothetical protein